MFKTSIFTNNLAAARVLEEAFPNWNKKIKDSSGSSWNKKIKDSSGSSTGKPADDYDVFSDIAKLFNHSHDVYPPSNMIRTKTGYIIEMALAGYNKSDINVTRLDDTLTVSCQKQRENDTSDYIHKGLAFKSFTKSYTLPVNSVVNAVTMVDGLLSIIVVEEKPKSKSMKFEIK